MWQGSRRASGWKGQGDALQSNLEQGRHTALFLCLSTRPPGTALSGRLTLPYLPPHRCCSWPLLAVATTHSADQLPRGLKKPSKCAILLLSRVIDIISSYARKRRCSRQQQRFRLPQFLPQFDLVSVCVCWCWLVIPCKIRASDGFCLCPFA